LAKKRCAFLYGVTELHGAISTVRSNMSKMTWTSVADFERDFEEAAGSFADQLLSLQQGGRSPSSLAMTLLCSHERFLTMPVRSQRHRVSRGSWDRTRPRRHIARAHPESQRRSRPGQRARCQKYYCPLRRALIIGCARDEYW